MLSLKVVYITKMKKIEGEGAKVVVTIVIVRLALWHYTIIRVEVGYLLDPANDILLYG